MKIIFINLIELIFILFLWNSHFCISYVFLIRGKYRFLQAKVTILLNFLHMLKPQETWSSEARIKIKRK
jgi:hypothetical protein